MSDSDAPAEARLIRRTRAAQIPKLSIRRAAELAGISEGRWRQIESGFQWVRAGDKARVDAPPETLARMASVLGISARELKEAGRSDAASFLMALQENERRIKEHERHFAGALSQVSDEELLDELGRRLRAKQRRSALTDDEQVQRQMEIDRGVRPNLDLTSEGRRRLGVVPPEDPTPDFDDEQLAAHERKPGDRHTSDDQED
ncbi:helix-turn-helix domain-containing protein [Hoyosella altamirensis]|uniref:Uncharacterized protein n=1 Tax=Hoyosella altamirensis TaxID=616997 RepID=A0A839RGR0_9ACTN|nr:helix-turn-helix transcriptional regulator [Hoyosella altamirensis]MBB3035567.1 hypothetical protein [Hoyosella altamirensis]